MNLERAIEIAVSAHKGQVDKAGHPYVLHPLRVMLACAEGPARIVAVLHDVVEDTKWTFDDLRAEGFGQDIMDALDGVTLRDGENYQAFVARAAGNPISREVKLEDIRDNMDLSRITSPTENDYQRIEKYHLALDLLADDAQQAEN